MYCNVMYCKAIYYNTISYYIIWYDMIWYHIIWYHIILHYIISFYAMLCNDLSDIWIFQLISIQFLCHQCDHSCSRTGGIYATSLTIWWSELLPFCSQQKNSCRACFCWSSSQSSQSSIFIPIKMWHLNRFSSMFQAA